MNERILELAEQAELCYNFQDRTAQRNLMQAPAKVQAQRLLKFLELVVNDQIISIQNIRTDLTQQADSDFDDGYTQGLAHAELIIKRCLEQNHGKS